MKKQIKHTYLDGLKYRFENECAYIAMVRQARGQKLYPNICYTPFFAMQEIMSIYKAFLCKIFGHKIIEDGYANPDSGAMIFECTRCGWGQRITLY